MADLPQENLVNPSRRRTLQAVGLAAGALALPGPNSTPLAHQKGVRLNTPGAPFTFFSTNIVSQTVRNDILYLTYNLLEGTTITKVVSAEPMLRFSIEANWRPPGGGNFMEYNLDYTSADGGTSRRFIYTLIDRATHNCYHTFGCETFSINNTDVGGKGLTFNMSDANKNVILAINSTSLLLGSLTSEGLQQIDIGTNVMSASGMIMRIFPNKLLLDNDVSGGYQSQKCTVAVEAPGRGRGMLRWEAGTNAGTLKLVAYAGTSTTGVTVVDNVGSGN